MASMMAAEDTRAAGFSVYLGKPCERLLFHYCLIIVNANKWFREALIRKEFMYGTLEYM